MYSTKSDLNCATPKCREHIAKWGAHQHRVYAITTGTRTDLPAGTLAQCEGCGGCWNGETWVHRCKLCGATVEPGELRGFFVPHRCVTCDERVVADERARGAVCRRCGTVFSYCCC